MRLSLTSRKQRERIPNFLKLTYTSVALTAKVDGARRFNLCARLSDLLRKNRNRKS